MSRTSDRPSRSRPARARRALRATFAALPTARRRARRDAAFLASYATLTAVIAGMALAAPVALARSADAGMRSAVTAAGPAAELMVSYQFPGDLAHPEAYLDTVLGAASEGLPDGLLAVTREPVGLFRTNAVPSAPSDPAGRDTSGGDPGELPEIALAHTRGAELTWMQGEAPGPPATTADEKPAVLEAAIAATTAEETGLRVGDRLTLGLDRPVHVRITGTFAPVRADDGAWTSLPGLLAPVPAAADRPAVATLFVPREALPEVFAAGARAAGVSVRFAPDPARLHTRTLDRTRRAVADALAGRGGLTVAANAAVPAVSTTLDDVLDTYAERLRTARAQVATVLVGLAASGALVLVLAAGLLVRRRRGVLELERARGASLRSVLVRAAAESLPLTAAAGLAAAAATFVVMSLLPGGVADGPPDGAWWLPGAAVLAVAAVIPAVLAVRAAAGAAAGRAVAANRRDRERASRAVAAWRGWAETGVVLLAATAVAGAWHRGLVPDGDLLLAAAPALVSAACTVLVLRGVPVVARALARAASRGPGLVGLVAASRAAGPSRGPDRGRGVAPAAAVMAVTTTCALAVSCAAAATTVRHAQERAGDVVVGADVRIDRPSDELAALALTPEPGVTPAAGTVFGGVPFGGDADLRVTVLALDAARFDHLAQLSGVVEDGAIDAVLPPALRDVARHVEPEVYVAGTSVPLRATGTTDTTARGPRIHPTEVADLPVVVVDRTALAAAVGAPATELGVHVVWLSGPGAEEAAGELARAAAAPGERATFLTRTGYERGLRGDALTQGLVTLYLLGAAALLALGAAATALTVQATAADRTRTLAVLRTAGVPARVTARLTVAELAPALGAAVVTGLAAGVLVAALLTSAQGLGLLAGGGDPVLRLHWWPFAASAASAAVVLAIAARHEARSRRQTRIGEVLRTW